MPHVMITWLPKACRTPEIRKKVAEAVVKAMVAVDGADVPADRLVVRFGEAVDPFPLPKGYSASPELAATEEALVSAK